MKQIQLFLFSIHCIMAFSHLDAQVLSRFKVTTGQKIEYEVLLFTQTPGGFTLKTPISENSFDNSHHQLKWELTKTAEGTHIKARRSGNMITLEGRFKHYHVNKEYIIDTRPWYQYPEVSLKEFVLSHRKRVEFWIISSADLAIFEFEAIKTGTEKVVVNKGSLKTTRIRIKALGFAGHFWHADYWFEFTNGRYVRYQAVHGGPGTPPTIKELIESDTN
jgi:hypothetical protein